MKTTFPTWTLPGIKLMKTNCENCQHKFSASDALCDDWQDPERAFGCPECGTFFVRDLRPDKKAGVIGAIGGGVGACSAMLLTHGILQADYKVVLWSAMIILLSLVGAVLVFSRTNNDFVRSPYRGSTAGREGSAVEAARTIT